MNAVDYAINEVCNSDIDEYLLKLAFENPNTNWAGNWFNLVNATTVEQGIREKVIHRTVLPACSMHGGKTELIDLSGAQMRDMGNGCVEVNVPELTTRGAKIISVTQVYLGSMSSAVGQLGMGLNENAMCGYGSINEMTDGLIGALAGNSKMPITYTNIHMTGNNCFVIFGLNAGTYSMSAKVILEYDEGMSSLHPRHFDEFSDMVNWATKAYIFRACKRATKEAVVRSGVALDDIASDIDAYRDAWQGYKDRFKEFKKTMAWSDRQARYEAVRMSTARRM